MLTTLFLALGSLFLTEGVPLPPPNSAANLLADAAQVEKDFGSLGPDVTVTVEACGELNAWYDPATTTITLCRELEPLSDAAIRFVVAHEMAHATVHQRQISNYDAEPEADELATLILLDAGDSDAVYAGAEVFMKMGGDGKSGTHPAGLKRAHMLLCLASGYAHENDGCAEYFESAKANWVRLFVSVKHAQEVCTPTE